MGQRKRKDEKRHTDWKIRSKTSLFRYYLVTYVQDSKGFIKQLELLSKNKKVSVFNVKILKLILFLYTLIIIIH